CALGIRDYW
nr:immunoglobulin heavy chain junction region [Mus musculus]MBK4189310.1 immunoglobulin heavy chain junction region [Mus musculus]